MKLLVIKVFALSVVLLLGLRLTDHFFADKHFYKQTITHLRDGTPYDMVILGSSRAHSSYDPRVFESELGLNTINLGAPAQKLDATILSAQQSFKNSDPKLVLIDIFDLSISRISNEKQTLDQFMTLNQFPWSWSKFNAARRISGDSISLEMLSTTVRNHGAWPEVLARDFSVSNSVFNSLDFYKGYRAYFRQIDSTGWAKFLQKYEGKNELKRELNLSDYEKEQIDRLVEVLKDHNCEMLFLNAPTFVFDVSARARAYSKAIGSYLQQLGLRYLDLNEIKTELGLGREHFSDPNHLNVQGAQLVSAYLSGFIAQEFDLPALKPESINLDGNRYELLNNDEQISDLFVLQTSPYRAELIINVEADDPLDVPVVIFNGRKELKFKLSHLNLIQLQNKDYLILPFNLESDLSEFLRIKIDGKQMDVSQIYISTNR